MKEYLKKAAELWFLVFGAISIVHGAALGALFGGNLNDIPFPRILLLYPLLFFISFFIYFLTFLVLEEERGWQTVWKGLLTDGVLIILASVVYHYLFGAWIAFASIVLSWYLTCQFMVGSIRKAAIET